MAPVSVVIPCFRCAATIRRSVESVLQQTLLPAQLILVDDCSDDCGKTRDALQEVVQMAGRIVRTKVITLSINLGPGEARNVGWEAADQYFIAFLDADDSWHRKKLEIQVGFMLANPQLMLTCHDTRIFRADREPWEGSYQIKFHNLDYKKLLFHNQIASRSVILKRSIENRFPAGVRYAEDFELWLRLVRADNRAVRIALPLATSYKREYDPRGQSGNLKEMHAAVNRCLGRLLAEGLISTGIYFQAVTYERIKYLRRIVISRFHSIFRDLLP